MNLFVSPFMDSFYSAQQQVVIHLTEHNSGEYLFPKIVKSGKLLSFACNKQIDKDVAILNLVSQDNEAFKYFLSRNS